MANKNILVSNNGKYEPISSSVDDVAGVLSSSLSVTANTSSFVAQSGLMQIYSGKLMPVGNTSSVNPPSDGIYSGSVLTYNNSEGFAPSRASVASFNGDISGDTISGIKVRSVGNVTGGVLSTTYGGTGTGSFSTNSLVTTNGSSLMPTDANKIVVASSNAYISGDSALLNFFNSSGPIVYLYTGSVGSNTIYTWSKPAGCRFIRVICQGGGGGGGKGSVDNGAVIGMAGSGGGGGGYSDVTFDGCSFSKQNIIITVGGGGFGAVGVEDSAAIIQPSTNGSSSSFGDFIYSMGGSAGLTLINPDTFGASLAGGTGGIGMTSVGGSGGSLGGKGGVAQNGGNVSMGAPGGGAGRNASADTGGNGGIVTGFMSAASGGTAGNRPTPAGNGSIPSKVHYFNLKKFHLNSNSVLSVDQFPMLLCGGGAGGGTRFVGTGTTPVPASPRRAGDGSSGDFGSGGGGGGRWDGSYTSTGGWGGNGGPGYVLIISY